MRPFTFSVAGVLLLTCLSCPDAALAAEKAGPPANPSAAERPPVNDEAEKPAGSKAEQLAAEQKKLGAMRLRHDEKHPAVVKQRAKVIRLKKEVDGNEAGKAPTDRAGQLELAKRDLEEMLKRYTEAHPLVSAQRRKIAELEAGK